MKIAKLAGLALFCAALGGAAAHADTLYSNGPINGETNAWTINFGFSVADSFTIGSTSSITGMDFGTWNFPGSSSSSVDWAILTGEPGSGTVLFSGTASLTDTAVTTNSLGYTIDLDTLSLSGISLTSGTYWVELSNIVDSQGNPVFWDVNGGPSQAWESELGDVTTCPDGQPGPNNRCSTAFDIFGNAVSDVPEPGSIWLLTAALSMFGLGFAFRRHTGTEI
jgi:hypothetical protein